MMPALFDKAYILHQRRYTDSRVILELLTEQQGIAHAVARSPGKRDRAKYETFQLVNVELMGSSELKTLRYCEQIADLSAPLVGTSLFCGLYLNELLQRLLSPAEPFPQLFHYYEVTLDRLRSGVAQPDFESALRKMEFFLLAQLGFGLDFSTSLETGISISAAHTYRYVLGDGFVLADHPAPKGNDTRLPGAHLLAIANGEMGDPAVLKTAKYISRRALSPLLNGKPLKSRELFS